MNFKKFFSRTVIAALIVIIEIVLVAVSVHFFSQWYLWLRIIGLTAAVFAALFILNKPQDADMKLPWIIALLLAPILSTIIYAFLGNAHFSKKQRRAILTVYDKTTRFISPSETERAAADEFLQDYAGIKNYLTAQTIASVSLGNKTTFLPTGEEFHQSLLKDLESAQRFVFMEYFIIEEGKMWDPVLEILKRKVKDGVKVCVVYDDVGCAGKLKHGYFKKLCDYGIECKRFNVITTLRPSGVFNNRDHKKITVIDGRVGYMGGINLADEYINQTHPFGHWKDSAIRIEGKAVETLTTLFLATFDYKEKDRSAEYEKYFPTDFKDSTEGDCVIPFGCGPLAPFDDQVGKNLLLLLINSAKKTLYITTPYLIVDRSITNALITAKLRGVDVRIITPSKGDKRVVHALTRSSYSALISKGIVIYEYTPGFLHSKQILVDGELAFVGTINFDYRSLAHHFECGAIIYGSPCVKEILKDFTELFNVSEIKTIENIKQRFITRLVLTVISVFRPLF